MFKSDFIRIVTTNYDEMFEQQLIKENKKPSRCYYAPAVPLGRNFKGFIHLHGYVKDLEFMVLTDNDFGRAYLLDEYVARFLVDLFKNYAVLFIGYSYNDLMVRYLTRAILKRNRPECYVLTDDHKSDWESLDLTPIYFHEKNYDGLNNSLEKLGNRTK